MPNTPSYVKIKDYIIENIKQGKYEPGQKIPSEKELSQLFNVSRITATTAIRDLVSEGLVFRIQGKGTYVAEKREENIRRHQTFGFEHNSPVNEGFHKTLRKRKIICDDEIAIKLGFKKPEEVFEIVRNKTIDGRIVALEYIYLPAKYYLSLNIDKEEPHSIHDLVEAYCFLKQDRAKVYVDPLMLNQEEADYLNVKKSNPMLLWEKFTYSEEDIVVEYSRNLINTDFYRFYMDLGIDHSDM